MSVKKSLIKNGIAASVQKIIRIAEQLLLIPFFISAWGPAYYGEWLTLTIIPSMLAFSDLGFGSAAANLFVSKYAKGDKQGAANTGKTGLFIITLMVIASFLVSAIIIFVLNFFEIFDKSLINKHDAIWAVSILMVARILNFYQQIYEAYFRAARRAALGTNLLSIYSSINLILGLLVLLAGGSIVYFACVSLFASIFFNPYFGYIAERTLSLNKTYTAKIDKSEIKNITRKGFGYLLSPVWQVIFFQGTTFVVRITLGPIAVAIFNTVRTVSRTANQAFSLIITTIYPDFQFELCAENFQKARKIFGAAVLINMLIAIISIILLYFFGPFLYQFWTHKALSPPSSMWNLFLIGIAFNSIWWTGIIIFQAANRPYEYTLAGVFCALFSVGISYFLCKAWGITGAALGSLILDIMLAFYVLPKGIKILKLSLKEFLTELLSVVGFTFKKFLMLFAKRSN